MSGNRNQTDEKKKEKENQQQNTNKLEDSLHLNLQVGFFFG